VGIEKTEATEDSDDEDDAVNIAESGLCPLEAVAADLQVEMVTVEIAEPAFYEDFRQLQEKIWIDHVNEHGQPVDSEREPGTAEALFL